MIPMYKLSHRSPRSSLEPSPMPCEQGKPSTCSYPPPPPSTTCRTTEGETLPRRAGSWAPALAGSAPRLPSKQHWPSALKPTLPCLLLSPGQEGRGVIKDSPGKGSEPNLQEEGRLRH